MMLENKNVVIHGGGGAIGGAAARAFAREGAAVFLAGRGRDKLDRVAAEVAAEGATVEVAQVDALDEDAVERHAGSVGTIDVCLNAVGFDLGEQGIPLVELAADDYCGPVGALIRTNFVTAKAAARHMSGGGAILALSPPMARMPTPSAGPFGMAGAAVEAMCRQMAAELGPQGVRVLCLRLNGIPETGRLGSHTGRMWKRAADRLGVPFERMLEEIGAGGPLPGPLTVEQVADVAVFLASGRAAGMTGTVANVTGGSTAD